MGWGGDSIKTASSREEKSRRETSGWQWRRFLLRVCRPSSPTHVPSRQEARFNQRCRCDLHQIAIGLPAPSGAHSSSSAAPDAASEGVLPGAQHSPRFELHLLPSRLLARRALACLAFHPGPFITRPMSHVRPSASPSRSPLSTLLIPLVAAMPLAITLALRVRRKNPSHAISALFPKRVAAVNGSVRRLRRLRDCIGRSTSARERFTMALDLF